MKPFPPPWRRLAPLVFPALLAACAVGPDYHTPTPHELLPQHFPPEVASVPAQPLAASAGPWWHAFHDPALDALVQAALTHSPDLDSADAAIRQSRAVLGEVGAPALPQVDAQARVGRDQFSTHSENFANIPFPNPKTGFTDYRVGFDASWEIDLFGHTRRSVQAAEARLGGVQEQRADAALRVAAETARNVLDYRYAQLRLTNARRALDDRRELRRLVGLAERAGMASQVELNQADIELRNAEAALAPLRSASAAAVAALGPLTALPHERIAALLATPVAPPILPARPPMDSTTQLLQRRPDLRAAERDLAAATANIGVAVSDQYPRLALVGDAGWDSIHAGMLTDPASRFWNAGPQLSLPLFAGGRLHEQVKAAEAQRDAALANYRKAVLVAFADVESALARCRDDHDRAQRLEAAQATQARQLAYARQRVQVGDSAQTDALGADLATAAVDDQLLAARQALATDVVALYKALGGPPGPADAPR